MYTMCIYLILSFLYDLYFPTTWSEFTDDVIKLQTKIIGRTSEFTDDVINHIIDHTVNEFRLIIHN